MEYLSFYQQLLELLIRENKTKSLLSSALACAISARGLAYPKEHIELFSLPLVRRHIAIRGDENLLFHVRHRYYLCRGFDLSTRIASALSHYRFENHHHSEAYIDSVYGGDGIVMWSIMLHGNHYEIRLRESKMDRQEGGTSIVMLIDGICLNEFSYAWVNAASINAGTGVIPFITRNQSIRYKASELHLFRSHFPQQSPHYFCLAAMQGIAIAHGFSKLAAIKCESQIAYTLQYANSFRNSYNDLWESFGGQDAGNEAYLMNVPMTLLPLDQIPSKHRNRAMLRRKQWATITKSVVASISPHIVMLPAPAFDNHLMYTLAETV